MNCLRRFSGLLAVGALGVGLAWSAARGGGPSPEGLTGRLPEVAPPRGTSMSLPMPRLERMSNAPKFVQDHGGSSTPINGDQLSAWLRWGIPLPKLADVESPRRRDAEKATLARRAKESTVK